MNCEDIAITDASSSDLSEILDLLSKVQLPHQFLSEGLRTRPFWLLGIFGEKTFGKYSLFINFENITDTRQGRFTLVVFHHTRCRRLLRPIRTRRVELSMAGSRLGFEELVTI